MLDNSQVWFPGNPKTQEFDTNINPEFPVLKGELESFTYELTSSGIVKYNAPEGLHDDTVIALALAAWQIKRNARPPKAIHG